MRSQDSNVPNRAGGYQADIQIGEADGNHAHPGPEHVVLVQIGDPAPRAVAHAGRTSAGEAIELAADQMAQRVARKRSTSSAE